MTSRGPGASDEPLEYHLITRSGSWSWWQALLGVVGLLISVFVLVQLILIPPALLYLAVSGGDVADRLQAMVDTDRVTPTVLAYLNVSLAAGIPVSMGVLWAVHRIRPRWLASVGPRIRWRWMAVCFGLALVALVATLLVSAVLPQQGDASDLGGQINDFTSRTRDFLLVIVLLTPLQAAGEEYIFRGYLTQAFGGLCAPLGPRAARVGAVLVPALLFALAHGAQDAPIFFDRFAFGVVAGILVIATGGLEAGIAMHVLNNFLAYGLALLFSDMTSALNPTGGTWWSLPTTLTQSIVFTMLAVVVARRMGIQTRTTPAVLAPPGARV